MSKYGIKALSLGDQRDIPYSYQARLNDPHDLEFQEIVPPNVKYLICSPIADQSYAGTCLTFASNYHIVGTAIENDQEPVNLSQLFLYYAYREQYGDVNRDDGGIPRDMLKTLKNIGVCREETWPYDLNNISVKPPLEAYKEAARYKIKSYHAVREAKEMIQCLASGYGFLGGIGCYESFESLETERTGNVWLPGLKEKLLGWHALYFCGYDLHKWMIQFENSYGPEWGNNGFGWIPIPYLLNPRLAGDFWTIR